MIDCLDHLVERKKKWASTCQLSSRERANLPKASIIRFYGRRDDGATTVEIDFRVSRIFRQGRESWLSEARCPQQRGSFMPPPPGPDARPLLRPSATKKAHGEHRRTGRRTHPLLWNEKGGRKKRVEERKRRVEGGGREEKRRERKEWRRIEP